MLIPTPRQTRLRADFLPVANLDQDVAFRLDPAPAWAEGLRPEQRPEAYRIEIAPEGAAVTALTPEGLLRAQATLRQLLRDGQLPCGTITDWPEFRYRCAADWLLNVEANRWGYDWGDGPEATLARMKRKLDFCADHKINQVWFDGFGWSLDRTPHYAALVRECSRYARARGIRLTFAGYGGGYGTSYQKSELYRCGYHGQTFLNREPWPDGEVYDCCGMGHVEESRRYGTCLSNEGLQAAKLAEMAQFVATVEPGFMYIHDIDAGTLAEAREGWLNRCPRCREHWPNDEMAAADGQAGAYAEWFGKVCDRLHGLAETDEYAPARDLMPIFTGPVYGSLYETPEVWAAEVEYFRVLSTLLGPERAAMFGFREQFLDPDGSRRLGKLRAALDEVGHGHGIHVIAFGGGDHYLSNDLVNVSAVAAPFYAGAASVCLSNGNVHEEPVQLLNAECLWHGAQGLAPVPTDAAGVAAWWEQICRGTFRPGQLFGPGGFLERACTHLWGPEAGAAMAEAYRVSGEAGLHPVSRVWWAVTREVRRLSGDNAHGAVPWEELQEQWQGRLEATREMLARVYRARELRPGDEDLDWLATCLEVGVRFAAVVRLTAGRKLGDSSELQASLQRALDDLEGYLHSLGELTPTDVLGGDPGCWGETLEHFRELARG